MTRPSWEACGCQGSSPSRRHRPCCILPTSYAQFPPSYSPKDSMYNYIPLQIPVAFEPTMELFKSFFCVFRSYIL